MSKTIKIIDIATIVVTDDAGSMINYVRTPEGRDAIARGLTDIRQGRYFVREPMLATIQF